MVQRLYRPLVFFLIPVLLIWGLVGCIPGPSVSSAVSPLPPCNDGDATKTFYQLPENLDSMINLTNVLHPVETDIINREADALSLLVHEVKRWSDYHDYQREDVTYRFTITLLSPELLASIFMAEAASHGRLYADSRSKLDEWLQWMRTYQEIMFLMTITSSNQGTLTQPDQQAILMPISNMTLKTINGLSTGQPHGEGIFDYQLDPYDAPIQYFFYYPAAVIDKDDICKPLLDSKRDLSFTLGIDSAQIGGKGVGSLSWNFDLAYIINVFQETDPYPLQLDEIVSPDKVPTFPLPFCQMPVPITFKNTISEIDDTEEIIYWRDFSLCVWDHFAGEH
jgi:hypothetical protein